MLCVAGEVAKPVRSRGAIATFLSCAIALAVAAAGTDAAAQLAYPPPPPPAHPPPPAAWPPPVTSSEPAPLPPPPNAFDRRHRLGVQLGGTGAFQVVYRYRAAGPLHLEVGGLGADHGVNVSAGVVVGVPVANRWFPYAGFGGGMMGAFGPKTPDGCDPKATDCPLVTDSDTLLVLHARAGVGFAFGATRRHLLSVDVGGWWGRHLASRTDAAGVETRSSARVLMPMAGLSYLFAL